MGEINLNDNFGKNIVRVVQENSLSKILEIGSHDGTGSTQCFIEALKNNSNPKLICIEANPDKFQILKTNTQQYSWIECFNMSTISKKSFVYKNFDELWELPFNKIKFTTEKEIAKTWYEEDTKYFFKQEQGFLEKNNDLFDGVLIDGSEFFGYSEYLLLKNRTNVFFLDDYFNAFKTHQVARELSQDPDWTVVAGDRYTRNGFAIFTRKTFLS
jgi:hypothetical protein